MRETNLHPSLAHQAITAPSPRYGFQGLAQAEPCINTPLLYDDEGEFPWSTDHQWEKKPIILEELGRLHTPKAKSTPDTRAPCWLHGGSGTLVSIAPQLGSQALTGQSIWTILEQHRRSYKPGCWTFQTPSGLSTKPGRA